MYGKDVTRNGYFGKIQTEFVKVLVCLENVLIDKSLVVIL